MLIITLPVKLAIIKSNPATKKSATIVPIVATVAGFVLVCAAAPVVFFMMRRRRSRSQERPAPVLLEPQPPSRPCLPPHTVLRKDSSLKDKTKELAGRKVELEEEFSRMEEWVKMEVKDLITVAGLEENKPHNRYIDIGRLLFLFLLE